MQIFNNFCQLENLGEGILFKKSSCAYLLTTPSSLFFKSKYTLLHASLYFSLFKKLTHVRAFSVQFQ